MGKEKILKIKVHNRDFKRYKLNVDGNPRKIFIDFRCIHKNSYGTINYGSRKRIKWTSPQQLENKINEYWESCNGYILGKDRMPILDEDGRYVRGQVKPYTTTGLAIALGIDRSTLLSYTEDQINALGVPTDEDYEGPTYGELVRAARMKIQEYAESKLYDRDGFNGGKFVLDCSFGWIGNKEKAEIKKMKKELQVKLRELELREKQLDLAMAEGVDEPINITIRRAGE